MTTTYTPRQHILGLYTPVYINQTKNKGEILQTIYFTEDDLERIGLIPIEAWAIGFTTGREAGLSAAGLWINGLVFPVTSPSSPFNKRKSYLFMIG